MSTTVIELPVGDLEGAARLVARGYRREAEILRLSVRVTSEMRRPSWPAGISVRTWRDTDAPAVHALLVAGYAGSREQVPPYRQWHAWFTTDASFEPTTCFLAFAESGLVGAALCWSEGFVKDLVVQPAWRRRGLGEALLCHAFCELAKRGIGEVSLKVDVENPTGALRLYERVGMRCTGRATLWARSHGRLETPG